jgi:hypothetical protein
VGCIKTSEEHLSSLEMDIEMDLLDLVPIRIEEVVTVEEQDCLFYTWSQWLLLLSSQ